MHSDLTLIFSALFTAFVLTYFFIPSIIKVAKIKHLYDVPDDHRKSHSDVIPTLGGIGIFGGFMIAFCLFANFSLANREIKYVLAALCFTFMLGAKDDIVDLVANKKFIGQIFSAAIIVVLGNIRITSMYGLFGITFLDTYSSIFLSILTIIFIVNAFNLIDGINLLAGSISIVISVAFGAWFYVYGFTDYAVLAAAMSGAVLAFLKYNFTPARIFMGDSGSMSIGLLAAILAIQFIEMNELILNKGISIGQPIVASPAMAIAVLIIPIYDALRVFTLRIMAKKSPFAADRNHIHHKLLDIGLSHLQATVILIVVNIFFIVTVYLLQDWGNLVLIILEILMATLLTLLLFLIKDKKKAEVKLPKRNVDLSLH